MKKIEIIALCFAAVLFAGCKKKPDETAVAPQPAAVKTVAEAAPPAVQEVKPAISKADNPQESEQLQDAAEMSAQADRIVWLTDFEAAQKKAAAEGKDLFLNFTGSDWCVWCQRLDREVFHQKLFAYMAQQHFVFVKLDFPRSTPQSKELKTQNEKLSQRYEVSGFPTIVLAEADGRAYAQTGYLRGGPLVYLEEVAKLQHENKGK